MTPTAATALAPANSVTVIGFPNRRVTLEEAAILQRAGSYAVNPRYGQHNEPARLWKARYLIHWRPQTAIPELNQYALATEVS